MFRWLLILVLLLNSSFTVADSAVGAVMDINIGERILTVGGVSYKVSPDVKVSLLGSENSVFTLLTTNMVVEVEYYLDDESEVRVVKIIRQLRKSIDEVMR
jgi:hypothetical protein